MKEEKYFKVTLEDDKKGQMKFEVKGLLPSQVALLATGVINQAIGQMLQPANKIVKPTLKDAIEIDKSKVN